jgi:ubiquinone/menaquinone biosynthesis C-methylase UbiE
MSEGLLTGYNEQDAANAFDRQAPVFDQLFLDDPIIRYKRARVRSHVLPFLKPASTILELNAGTGEDALYFAGFGHAVHATDLSEQMLMQLREKIRSKGMEHLVTHERCSFNHLDQLVQRGPYDHIFSNFAGLNCTDDLQQVLLSGAAFLKPGGMFHVVLMPPFCLWETMLLLKGNFRTATRRWLYARDGVPAKVEGKDFKCWYYSPSRIRRSLEETFLHIRTEGVCALVPPSYMKGFDRKYPILFSQLCKLENKLKNIWPWNSIGDYYIMSLQKPLPR